MKGLINMTTALINLQSAQAVTVENFGASLIERFTKFAGVGASSRQTYAKCLRQVFRFFEDNLIATPTRDNLIDWIEELKAAGKSASTTQENIFPNIADHLKSGVKPSHNHKKDALSTDQCAELCRAVSGDKLKDIRDRAILSLMTTAGLRTIEVTRANVGDIRFERGKTFLYVQGKGHSQADEKVLLSKQTYKAIQTYLKARGKAIGKAPLFRG